MTTTRKSLPAVTCGRAIRSPKIRADRRHRARRSQLSDQEKGDDYLDQSELESEKRDRFAGSERDDEEAEPDLLDVLPAVDATLQSESSEPDGDAQSQLSSYFRQMAQIPILRPSEELDMAKRIFCLEVDLWVRLLCFAKLTEHLVSLLERLMSASNKDLGTLKEVARTSQGSHSDHGRGDEASVDDRLKSAAQSTAERLRKLDVDRIYITACVDEIRRLSKGANKSDRHLHKALNTPAGRHYVQAVLLTDRRIRGAKHAFVNANLRLVVSIARRFNHGKMSLPDIIQEGNMGLIKAVERFDYRRGYRFSTYASWWIRHAISRGIADKSRAVRLPVHMIDMTHKVGKGHKELLGKLGRQPSTEEIALSIGISSDKIEKMKSYLIVQPISLDQAISDYDDRSYLDILRDESPQASERLYQAQVAYDLRRLIGELKPMEADVVRSRFGFESDHELTLKQVGEKYNLSRERIRQIQELALTKIRRALVRRHRSDPSLFR